ncbi:MAG: hypothetical protein LBP53_03225 [Candidatus Peribacteria bacterium]|nr:hypothetical protein [Candidatus Peribacteria bacterium]
MHFSKLSISSFSMFIIAINIFTGSMGLLAYHLFGQNRHVFVIQLFFLLVLLPIDSFLIAHKWYPFQHTF